MDTYNSKYNTVSCSHIYQQLFRTYVIQIVRGIRKQMVRHGSSISQGLVQKKKLNKYMTIWYNVKEKKKMHIMQ